MAEAKEGRRRRWSKTRGVILILRISRMFLVLGREGVILVLGLEEERKRSVGFFWVTTSILMRQYLKDFQCWGLNNQHNPSHCEITVIPFSLVGSRSVIIKEVVMRDWGKSNVHISYLFRGEYLSLKHRKDDQWSLIIKEVVIRDWGKSNVHISSWGERLFDNSEKQKRCHNCFSGKQYNQRWTLNVLIKTRLYFSEPSGKPQG